MKNLAIAIHGGAGTIKPAAMSPAKEHQYLTALQNALAAGHTILTSGGTALDAVLQAVKHLEDNPVFNAGKGSVFTHAGNHEMDAAIMCGRTLTAGAVANVKNVRNPVLLANAVRLYSDHVFLAGAGAEAFAREQNQAFEPDQYFYDAFRFAQWQNAQVTNQVTLDHTPPPKIGTVGAVALDLAGNLAAATSTGGMTNKKYNRIGDSPVIGAGTYANNQTCAVSCTGHGEYFLRAIVAYDISCLMEYKGYSLQQACHYVVKDKLVKMGGEGGLIAVDARGDLALVFNSEGMYRASRHNQEPPYTRIYQD